MRHVSNRNFVLIISSLVGVVAGLAAVFLKSVVHYAQRFFTQNVLFSYQRYLLPLVGILITVGITNLILKEKLGHGITDILYTIAKKSGVMARSKMSSRIITSIFTVGFGGSSGLEAPSVVTGGAIGSNIAQLMHLNYKKRSLLIGCGAAGAIAAIFNAPVAGVIFSIEVILAEVSLSTFIPLLIASVSATLVSMTLLGGGDTTFYFRIKDAFVAADVPAYGLLGVLCGFVSLLFIRGTNSIESSVQSIPNSFVRAILGGSLLCGTMMIFPAVYGEGYNVVTNLLNGNESLLKQNSGVPELLANPWYFVIYLAMLVVVKIIATALTIGAGGSGGIFGPSLVVGGFTGFCVAKMFNTLDVGVVVSESNFTMVGMCGLMSGVQFAPLTAIFMIAEVTGGYTLFVPLMLVSAIAYSTVSVFEPYSIYTKRLIEKGDLFTHDKDRQLLSMMSIEKLIEKDLLKVSPEATLGDLVNLVRLSKRNIFPVVNEKNQLMGIVTLDDIRKIMFDESARKNTTIKSLMHTPPSETSPGEDMALVMQKFEMTGAWNLPVIDNGSYVGFVSKSSIFNAYRKRLIRQHREE
jgi:CIC family chloride channel protein